MEENDKSFALMLGILEVSPLLDKMETEWETLAKELNVPSSFIEGIRYDVLLYSANSKKTLTDILLNWRLRCGSKANFTTLIKIIEERCHWIHIGAQMQRNKESFVASEITQETKWKDLPPCKQGELCTKEVRIFGIKRSLMSFAKGITGIGLRIILNDTLNQEDLYNFVNTIDYELTRSTLPEALPYYVERKVFLRNMISLNSFSSNNTDIFAVKGIDRETLGLLARSHTDLSSNQINNITCRFIILEQPDHFDQLCRKTTSTLHYIRFQMGNYLLVKTYGNVENILKFEEKSVCINEDSFVKIHLAKHSPYIVCITGKSGEGKTTFLANVARKLLKYHKERVVIFISIRYILVNVSQDEILCKDKIIKLIAKVVSPYELGRKLMSNICANKNYQLELFLDGYDELMSSERIISDKVLDILAKEFNNFRIFITANENQYKELELKFGSISWGMDDFGRNSQAKLLSLYWNHFQKVEITKNLHNVSEQCVNLLASSKNLHTIQFVGKPMFTAILAQQFENLVRDFLAGTKKSLDSRRHYVTNSLLYETFFQGKFEKVSLETKRSFIQLALERTFPKTLSEILSMDAVENADLTNGLQYLGLIHKSSVYCHLEFLHQSFAEYISIQHLIDEIQEFDVELGTQSCTPMLSHLLQTSNNFENKVTFVNLTLCSVFEAFLLDQTQLKNINAAFIFEQVSSQKISIKNIFLACVNSELYAIFCLLLRGIPKTVQTQIIELPDISAIGHDKLFRILDVASRHVGMKLAKKLLEILKISQTDICSLQLNRLKPLGIMMTPLHFAASQGNTKLFNYFFNSINMSFGQAIPMFLCHAIVYNSKYDLAAIISSKVEIITKLVRITYGQILHEKSDQISLVHLLPNIHITILKCIIESGADLFAVDPQQNNLGHQISEYMTPDEYHDFVEILLHRGAGSIFRKYNRNNETAFTKALRVLKLEERTLHLLLTSKELHTGEELSPKDTYVYQVIKAGYGSDVLATALENTSDWNKGYFVRGCVTLLHVAVMYQNIEAVTYLIDIVGISVNARDENGKTPYHVACSSESLGNSDDFDKSLTILELLLEHGADVRLTDNSGKMPLCYLLNNASSSSMSAVMWVS